MTRNTRSRRRRRPMGLLRLEQSGSPFTISVWADTSTGEPGVRIDNLGPFPIKDARRLRDWLTRWLTTRSA